MKRKSQEKYYRSTPLFWNKLLKEGGQLYWAFPFSEFSLQKECHSSLYYKPITIVNGDSSVINKFETSLTDDARVILYNCHVFIKIQATEVTVIWKFLHFIFFQAIIFCFQLSLVGQNFPNQNKPFFYW